MNEKSVSDEKTPETMSSTDRAYRVEVRAAGRPIVTGDRQAIGRDWEPLPEVKTFPLGTAHDEPRDSLTGTHNYYGAMALACSFMSSLHYSAREVEVRIIEYKRKVDFTLIEKKVMELPNEIDELFSRAGFAEQFDANPKEKVKLCTAHP